MEIWPEQQKKPLQAARRQRASPAVLAAFRPPGFTGGVFWPAVRSAQPAVGRVIVNGTSNVPLLSEFWSRTVKIAL